MIPPGRHLPTALLALALLAAPGPARADEDGWDEVETIGEDDDGGEAPPADDGWEVEDVGAPPTATPAPAASAGCPRPESFVRVGGKLETRLAVDTSFEASDRVGEDGVVRPDGQEDVVELRNRFRAHLEGALIKDLNFHVGVRLTHWAVSERSEGEPFLLANGEHGKAEFLVELWEAYADVLRLGEVLDLRVGTQIVAWGANELGLSPADRVNPSDMTALLGGEEDDLRLPVFAVKADLYVAGLKGEVVWVPFYRAPRMTLWGQDFSLLHARPSTAEDPFGEGGGLGGLAPLLGLIDETKEDQVQDELLTTEQPEDHLGSSQAAVRLSGSAGPVDLAASFWYGYDPVPRFRLDESFLAALDGVGALGAALEERCGETCELSDLIVIAAERPALVEDLMGLMALTDGALPWRSHVTRMLSVAGELTWLIDPVTLKLDVGFTPGRTLYTADFRAVNRMMLQSALGLDYNYGEELLIGVTGFHFSVLDRGTTTDPATGQRTDEEYLFFEPHSVGLVGFVEWSFGDDLEYQVRLLAMYEVMVNDVLLAPELAYAFDDHLRLALGAVILEAEPAPGEDWFTGHDRQDRPLGFFSNNDHVYLELSYAF